MTYHDGVTLQQQLDHGRHFPIAEVARVGTQLAKGIGVMQRLSILHRDIKPANLLPEDGGGLRILDMGVALAAGVPYPELRGNPGTPSFMAPELFAGEQATVQSDIYAAGVTLYHLLTRHYPYGEIEPFQSPHFSRSGSAVAVPAGHSRLAGQSAAARGRARQDPALRNRRGDAAGAGARRPQSGLGPGPHSVAGTQSADALAGALHDTCHHQPAAVVPAVHALISARGA